jgi:hypothetical protein
MNPLLQVCGLLRLQNGKQRRENQTLDIIIVNGEISTATALPLRVITGPSVLGLSMF